MIISRRIAVRHGQRNLADDNDDDDVSTEDIPEYVPYPGPGFCHRSDITTSIPSERSCHTAEDVEIMMFRRAEGRGQDKGAP